MSLFKKHSLLHRNKYFVRKTWRFVSGLGSSKTDKISEMRSNVVSNQLNFVLFGTMFFLLLFSITINLSKHVVFDRGIWRIVHTLIFSFLNLVLAHFRFTRLSRYSLIFLTPIVFLIAPTLYGIIEEEGYFYNAYVLIAASTIPQLILSEEKEKVLYWIAMVYYFLLLILLNILMLTYHNDSIAVLKIIKNFSPYYILSQIAIFAFINISIWHIRVTSNRFEERLYQKNRAFDIQNRELREQREKIVHQKNLIEERNRSISESIQYASRIQKAVLQPIDFLEKWGIGNFILYKPKAVVSGDFYWGYQMDGKTIIAVGDCTGHGVPGAFMCMLGLAFLDDIMIAGNFSNAAGLLNILREDIMNKLKQKGNSGEMREGMDISLCIIDKKAGSMEYAGANNPIYLIRDGSLTRIQPDKMPIGIYSLSIEPFTNNVLEIRKGDIIYLFTDGYADQFGGPDRRKFLYKPFQDLLLKNHMEPMAIQKDILDNTFQSWKGDYDQIDDVLVMGLRL
jgi:serine phosphatase RsbU (regulator of sigma subunit)